jgi:hypothetical protein
MISKLHEMYGNKWTFIASKMPGRSGNDVKVRVGDGMRGGCVLGIYIFAQKHMSLILFTLS